MNPKVPARSRLSKVLVTACLVGTAAAAMSAEPPAPAPDVAALQKENAQLLQQIQTLQQRLQAIEGQAASTAAAPAIPAPAKHAPPVGAIAADHPDFQFLKLGQDADYMQAERRRIVEQIEQAIPPAYEPVRPLHGYVLPPGVARIRLGVGGAHNPGNFGRDDFYSKFFDNVQVDVLQADAQFMYGFEAFGVHDLMVNVEVPFKMVRAKGTGHPFRIDPMTMSMNGSGAGLGDVEVTLKKKWLDQGNSPLTLSTMVGLILPTGKDDVEFNAAQSLAMMGMPTVLSPLPLNVFGREMDDRLFPRSLQPGQGSWGGRLGLAATHQYERSAVHAGFIYDIFRKNGGITVGNELRYGVSYVFPPLRSDWLSVDLSVFGKYKGDEKFPGMIMHPDRDPATGGPLMDAGGNLVMVVTPRPNFKHGNVVFFSPSLSVIPAPNFRLSLSPSVRIIEPNKGPSPAWTFDLSMQHSF